VAQFSFWFSVRAPAGPGRQLIPSVAWSYFSCPVFRFVACLFTCSARRRTAASHWFRPRLVVTVCAQLRCFTAGFGSCHQSFVFCFEVISLHSVLLQLLCRAEVFQMISPAQPISTFGSMRFDFCCRQAGLALLSATQFRTFVSVLD
jgi:hypothetical protein